MLNDKIQETIEEVKKLASSSEHPVLWFSGGKDSTLLLDLLLAADVNISLLVFQDLWSRSHRKYVQSVVAEKDLKCFFYSPVGIETTHNGTIVAPIYNVNEEVIPILMDVKPRDNICGHDKIQKVAEKAYLEVKPPYIFDLTFVGSKETDSHKGKDTLLPRFERTQVVAPLWQWTDEEVWDAILLREIPYNRSQYNPDGSRCGDDNGDFIGCLNCYRIEDEEVYCPKTETIIPVIGRN